MEISRFWLTITGALLWLPMGCAATTPTDDAGGAMAVVRGTEAFNSGGKRIRVESFIPERPGRYPAVLVLYGSGGSVAGKAELEQFAQALAEQRTAVFLVHYFNRTGTLFVTSDAEIVRLSEVWTDTVRDGIAFAQGHPRVREGSVGLFGYSLGAYLAVAESSRNREVAVVAEVAGGMFSSLKGKIAHLPPLLILHGRRDERVPVQNAVELEATARRLGGRPEVHIYENEGHRLSRPALADATQRSLRFFAKHLTR
jgi:carboxymethylenebutenolidase